MGFSLLLQGVRGVLHSGLSFGSSFSEGFTGLGKDSVHRIHSAFRTLAAWLWELG